MNEQPQKRSVIKKLFFNERGEVSLRKVGGVIAAIGGWFVAGGLGFWDQSPDVGKGLIALGAMIAGLGQFEANDRSRKK